MTETPLEKNEIQLTKEFRLGFEKMNMVLTRRYQKREGKGANASFIDEYAYDRTKASYFGTTYALARRLAEESFLKGLTKQDLTNVTNFIEVLNKATEHVREVEKSIKEHLDTHITIDLGENPTGRGRKKQKETEGADTDVDTDTDTEEE